HSRQHPHCVEERDGHCSCFTFLEDLRTARDRAAGLEHGPAQEAIRALMVKGFVELRAGTHVVKRAQAAGERMRRWRSWSTCAGARTCATTSRGISFSRAAEPVSGTPSRASIPPAGPCR